MSKYQHLTLEDRVQIKVKLEAADSFRKIAKDLGKSPTTISQEIRKHRTRVEKNAFNTLYNPCKHRHHCPARLLCGRLYCKKKTCSSCKEGCSSLCPHFEEEACPLLQKAPFVCNGCKQKNRCGLTKYVYMPPVAQNEYRELLSDARSGRSYSPEEIQYINKTVKADLKRGFSPYTIWVNHKNELPCSHRTIYRLIQDRALGDVSAFDLPYKIRYRPRKKKKEHKIDTQCRKGRTYQDFQTFMGEDPWPVVEMDSVIGTIGGKVILSLYFQESSMLFLFLRERNTAKSVIDLFDRLDHVLGRDRFRRLFPVLLTDNGSEFSNPKAIEFDGEGQRRTRIYYCDPGTPNQKPGVEGAHKHLRRILPRGTSFDQLTQDDLNLVMGHVNGFPRKRLNDRTPLQSFSSTFGKEVVERLNIPILDPSQVILRPDLLRKNKKEID